MELVVIAEEKVGGDARWTNGNGFAVEEEEDGDDGLKGNGGLAFMTSP